MLVKIRIYNHTRQYSYCCNYLQKWIPKLLQFEIINIVSKKNSKSISIKKSSKIHFPNNPGYKFSKWSMTSWSFVQGRILCLVSVYDGRTSSEVSAMP